LRLDLLLLVAHHMMSLGGSSHICDEEDAKDVHPAMGALTRAASRAAEELVGYLPHKKMNYVCGPVAGAAARDLMWVLGNISEINPLGVERMVRSLALLQGPLTNLGAASAAAAGDVGHPGALPVGGAAEVAKVYDKARGYYTLVGMPGDELVRMASKTPLRYSVAEWQALLQVRVPGRVVEDNHQQQLFWALDKVYHLSAGQKAVEVLQDIKTSVQVPVQTITGGLAAGLKGGVLQARALLKQAATTVADKATDVSEAARQRMASNANLQQQQTSGGGVPPSVEGSSASMSSASIMSRVQSMARGISSEQQKG